MMILYIKTFQSFPQSAKINCKIKNWVKVDFGRFQAKEIFEAPQIKRRN